MHLYLQGVNALIIAFCFNDIADFMASLLFDILNIGEPRIQ